MLFKWKFDDPRTTPRVPWTTPRAPWGVFSSCPVFVSYYYEKFLCRLIIKNLNYSFIKPSWPNGDESGRLESHSRTVILFWITLKRDKKVKVPRNVCQAAFELASNSRKRQFRVKLQCCTMRPYCTELCIAIKEIGHHITTSISYKFSEKNLIFFF